MTHFFDLEDITGNDFRSVDFSELAITENNCLERKSLLQFVDNGAGLELLDETDGSVEK
jgi:hypothetical protein